MILAMDLGGTKLQYGVFDQSATPLFTATDATDKDFVGQIQSIVQTLVAEYDIHCVSIGVPGPTLGTVMQGSKPLGYMEDLDFAAALAPVLENKQLVLNNDLNMAAHCELHQGVGREKDNFCLVSLSTGIGVAVVTNGQVLDRRTEMGHQVFTPDFEPQQPCTNHNNCWASLASGSGIEKRFATEHHQTTEAIFQHVLSDEDSQGLRQLNAQAFGNMVNAYDPEVIVVMGSLALKQFEYIIPRPAELEPFTINRPTPDIVPCEARENIGMLGAYYAAFNASLNTPQGGA